MSDTLTTPGSPDAEYDHGRFVCLLQRRHTEELSLRPSWEGSKT